MGLETPSFVSDLVTTNPTATDFKSQGDDHLRAIKTALAASFPNSDRAFRFPRYVAKTTSYTILSTDMSKTISFDATAGALAPTLPTLVSGDDGWMVRLTKIDSSANAVTITPPAGTINGASTVALTLQWQSALVVWTGSTFYAFIDMQATTLGSTAFSGLTALTAVAVDDSLPIYDLSATANKKATVQRVLDVTGILAAEAAVALDDLLLLYDLSETAANAMTPVNLLKVLNLLTEDATPDSTADFFLSYDTSAGIVKKVLPKYVVPQYGVRGYKYAFTAATTGTTSNAGTAYPYSASTAPTTANANRSDDTTLAYTAKYSTSVLEFNYDCSVVGNENSHPTLALYRSGNATAIAWAHEQGVSSDGTHNMRFVVTVPDTAAYTYTIRTHLENTTTVVGAIASRRLFQVKELVAE